MMRKPAMFIAALAVIVAAAATTARADYAILRSGMRLHITGCERVGDRVRLTVEGGVVEMAASDLVTVEPEDVFPALPPAPAAPAGPYAALIHAAALRDGVSEKLITHVIAVESNFNPRAVSRKRAQGLMQLLPETAARYSVANVFDPAQNIDGGTRYLKDLLELYHGDLKLALAAYNAGPDMVQRYGGIPPFPETQNYVKRITSELAEAEKSPE
jgi:soluble lytic murein transglycosylase-like protein